MERIDHLRAWATARAVGNLLDARGATWAIVGGIAANVYRHDVRATGDVDLLVSFGTFDSAAALATLSEEMERAGWEFTDRRNAEWMLRAHHRRFGTIDVIAVGMAYQKQAVDRAVAHDFDDSTSVRVLAIEDVIIHKLIADRSKDAADVESILASDPQMDTAYLDHWLNEWGIMDRYERARSVVRQRQAALAELNRRSGR